LGTFCQRARCLADVKVDITQGKEIKMRGLLLWIIGIPLPLIILLYLFGVF